MVANQDNGDKTQSHIILKSGAMVGHYKIIEKVGSGGMGEIYLAEDMKLNRRVALKFLATRYISDTDFKARFTREAQAVAQLNHVNVVTIFEVGDFHGRPYFAMEHVAGESLKNVIRSGGWSLGKIIDLAMETCEGLREAHTAGVVHRDIKPSNILISKSGRPKLVDFGLAAIAGTDKLTKTGSTLGTIAYMSPEQVEAKEIDQRSDIFSFGVVFYEMLTGRQPFEKENEAATLYAIVNKTPDPVAQFRKDMPVEIQAIISKVLEKNQEMRYRHVDDLLTDLKRVKQELDSMQPVANGKAVPLSLSRPNLYPWIGSDPVPTEKHLVVLPFVNIGKVHTGQAFSDGLMETVSSKLTQLGQFQDSLWVVPATEVREGKIASAGQARRAFGVTLAVTGSVQRLGETIRITMNLVDTETQRQLRSLVIDDSLANITALQDLTVVKLVEMLEIELRPEQHQFLTAGGTTVPKAYDFFLQGQGYLQHFEKIGSIDTAVSLLQQALAEDPHYALALAGLGSAYWQKYKAGKESQWLEFAAGNCRHALKLCDQLAVAHVTLGLIYKETGRYEEAVAEFKQALALDSANHEAYRGLARSYESLDQMKQAESTYQKAIEVKPGYWLGYYSMGRFYIRYGRHEKAVEQLHKVLKLVPDNFQAHNNLGVLYSRLERPDKARVMWERSLEIEPNYGAYSNLGYLHFMGNHYSEAVRMYEKALKLDDHDYRVWGNLAMAYYWIADNRTKAISTFLRAAQMAEEQRKVNPHDSEVLSDLAEYYAVMEKRPEAESLVNKVLSLAANDTEVMVRAGIVYEWLGERDKALEWIGEALKQGYPRTELEPLPELRKLRSDLRFQELLQIIGDEAGGELESDRQ